MVMIMELTLDTCLTENERYGDEVLNANWLPQISQMLGQQSARTAPREPRAAGLEDPESFLQRLYRLQE